MADRENAIKRLKYLHDVEHWTPSESSDEAKARRTITKEAIELLKAQEPVPPKGIHKCIYGGWLNGWCWHCGQAIDWDKCTPEDRSEHDGHYQGYKHPDAVQDNNVWRQ